MILQMIKKKKKKYQGGKQLKKEGLVHIQKSLTSSLNISSQ